MRNDTSASGSIAVFEEGVRAVVAMSRIAMTDKAMPIWQFKAIGTVSFVAARVIGRISDPSVLNRPVCGEGKFRSVAAGRSAGNWSLSVTDVMLRAMVNRTGK
jgi:hypothetical protein